MTKEDELFIVAGEVGDFGLERFKDGGGVLFMFLLHVVVLFEVVVDDFAFNIGDFGS